VHRPLFSVLIPSRNRLELLHHAVDSVLGQEADFEIVISDNASEEPYTDYVASLGSLAEGSVRTEEPLPVTENWNRALQASRGRYVVMLGDDDALVPGWLARAAKLIDQFDQPSLLYSMAYHYAYPNVLPTRPEGYLATVDNADVFRTFDRPYLLPRRTAVMLGKQALRFRHRFSFNSQHFIWNRELIDSLSAGGDFFRGPYPDYYTAMASMLLAHKVVVVPTAEVVIGISPKSYGFYHNNQQFDAGRHMLGNTDPDAAWQQSLSDEARAAIAFPGSPHYRSWLLSALLVAHELRLTDTEVVDFRRYRRLQLLEIVSGRAGPALSGPELLELLKPHLRPHECQLLRRLRWLERMSKRMPIGPAVVHDALSSMGGIYTAARVTEHDIGEHVSIADALRCLATGHYEGPPPPEMDDEVLVIDGDGTKVAEAAIAANKATVPPSDEDVSSSEPQPDETDRMAGTAIAANKATVPPSDEDVSSREPQPDETDRMAGTAIAANKATVPPSDEDAPSSEPQPDETDRMAGAAIAANKATVPPLDEDAPSGEPQPDDTSDRTVEPAVEEFPIQILEPISREKGSPTIAVAYLARSATGSIDDFAPFIASYRAHAAGIAHDLIIIRKGLHGRSGSQAALTAMLDGIPHRTVDVSDNGFDIQAYLRLAPCLRHDRVCFLNTFSEIRADNWLQSLNAPLDRAEVGATGATASYESLFTSLYLLSKIVWLTAIRDIQYSPEIAEQFHEQLVGNAPAWLGKRGSRWLQIKRELARPVLGRPIDTDEIEAGYQWHWEAITRPGGPLSLLNKIKPFPNPHLRSNAFMMRRELLIDLDFQLDDTKQACNLFESGRDGMPARLAQRGLGCVLVGADGVAYDVADWPKSRTFRLGDQANVLVFDNQVNGFAAMPKWQKTLHVRMTWGRYLPKPKARMREFGVTFERSSLDLLPWVSPEIVAKGERPFFSVVIPTRNRLALLRDAVDSVRRQASGDWECVIFDNASDEPVGEYVTSLGDPRIRYERSDAFLPVTASWNRAINLARGAYVTLIGDDDGLVPGYFRSLTKIIETFSAPDVIYCSLYQFFHPAVAPWERAGYVADIRNGFFFGERSEPFFLSPNAARKAVEGSLNLRRNFTFNMQAFTFSRAFLSAVRIDGAIFHSPFPDYYLANMAMGLAHTIVVSPQPLVIAGVSKASFGFTLFNNLEATGAELLNAKLQEDSLYSACEPQLLPGPQYNTNYIITMEHVFRNLGTRAPCAANYRRYRRLQIFTIVTASAAVRWMRSPTGSQLWRRLTTGERAWATYIGFRNWRARSGDIGARWLAAKGKALEPYGFRPVLTDRVVGRFARLPELFNALRAGTYPPGARPIDDSMPTAFEEAAPNHPGPEASFIPTAADEVAQDIELFPAEAEGDAVARAEGPNA
jgi:glycosyltransferase involved in cell wall biosynthesis